ncbi:MAG: disulfide bond formation protein B [Gammaproteobacteria bacterium]
MTKLYTTRWFYFIIFSACLALLGFGLYLEHGLDLEPCPLCIFQRIAFIVIALIAFTGFLHGFGKVSSRIYGGLMVLAALTGAGIAGRQVWLEHLPPDKVPACGPGLDYILDTFPLSQALKMVLSGSGECAEVQWQFLGLSIAEWSLSCFLLFIVAGSFPFYATLRQQTL